MERGKRKSVGERGGGFVRGVRKFTTMPRDLMIFR